ncbi:hypothetical protein C1646_767880 [Rhizophagus diaphanus]|nr:hypothetical protein C1646_767880 [Rhizophagus diaphanus] [Rhizophagus sp. MUCL 43196]
MAKKIFLPEVTVLCTGNVGAQNRIILPAPDEPITITHIPDSTSPSVVEPIPIDNGILFPTVANFDPLPQWQEENSYSPPGSTPWLKFIKYKAEKAARERAEVANLHTHAFAALDRKRKDKQLAAYHGTTSIKRHDRPEAAARLAQELVQFNLHSVELLHQSKKSRPASSIPDDSLTAGPS